MTQTSYAPTAKFAENAHIDQARYEALYAQSIEDPISFWAEHGKRVDWIKPFETVKNVSYEHPDVSIKWFEDGTLNVSANCIDRHLESRGSQTAIIWEGDNPADSKHITYHELHQQVSKLSNVYKSLGVKKGDRVVLYMPMIPEAAYAMLACTR
ncbi:MAG: AMP-binding protein, partial [Rhodobacteraceae bacterium]|nr:AMP-binding protein [Paracoccaceae bacterium]